MYSCETKTMWNFLGVIKKKLQGISRGQKSPTPETQYEEGIFQIQYPICAVIFTNKMSRSR